MLPTSSKTDHKTEVNIWKHDITALYHMTDYWWMSVDNLVLKVSPCGTHICGQKHTLQQNGQDEQNVNTVHCLNTFPYRKHLNEHTRNFKNYFCKSL